LALGRTHQYPCTCANIKKGAGLGGVTTDELHDPLHLQHPAESRVVVVLILHALIKRSKVIYLFNACMNEPALAAAEQLKRDSVAGVGNVEVFGFEVASKIALLPAKNV
jgi:hypothetical protein